MLWHMHKQSLPRSGRGRSGQSARRGSFVIDVAIGVALLATAAYGLAQLASGSAALNRHADQRLAALLAAENTRARVRRASFDRLPERAEEIASAISLESRCEVDVSTEPFTSGGRNGIHIRVVAKPATNTQLTLHDWRFETETSQPSDGASGDASGEADSE